MKRIYLDTNIWDQLCDQKVDPKQFIDALASKGYTLVISFHPVYEFARTLTSPAPQAIARGRQLCAYAVQYFDLGIPAPRISGSTSWPKFPPALQKGRSWTR